MGTGWGRVFSVGVVAVESSVKNVWRSFMTVVWCGGGCGAVVVVVVVVGEQGGGLSMVARL